MPPSPLTVSGGRPTAYRVLPGGRYPRAVCTAPGGHGSTPGGLAVTKTKPHADDSSMRFGSPGGRALYNRSGVTGLSWIYRDYSLCGCHSACRYHRHHQHTISVWLCQALFFDVLRRPQENAPGARRGGAGPRGPGPPERGPGGGADGPRRATTPHPRRLDHQPPGGGVPVPPQGPPGATAPGGSPRPHPGGMHQGAPGRPAAAAARSADR